MNVKVGAIIIPNESVLNVPTFIKIGKDLYHAEIYREFSVFYFDELYDKFELLDKDFIILEIVENAFSVWVPSEITEKQYEELKKCKNVLTKAATIDIGVSNDKGYDFISSSDFADINACLEHFYKKVEEECLKKRGRK